MQVADRHSVRQNLDNKKMTFVKTKGGGLQETGAKDIPLDFSHDNLLRLLNELIIDKCNYTHQDFANWARKYHMFCITQLDNGNDLGQIEDILRDIDMQWDASLFNTYSTDQLLNLDLSTIKFPVDLLNNWLTQVKDL